MDKKEHTLRAYDEALKRYTKQTLQLFQGSAAALGLSSLALKEWNMDLARQVVSEDRILDTLHDAISNRAVTILASFGPLAIDLRFVLALMRISTILERLGDHASKISKYSLKIDALGYRRPIEPITNALDYVIRQFKRTCLAFESGDTEMVREYLKMHREKDGETSALSERLLSITDYKKIPVPVLAQLILISRTIEHVWASLQDLEEEIAQLPFLNGGHEPRPGNKASE